MSDVVDARVVEMRTVALILDTKGAAVGSFATFVTTLGSDLLVDVFATDPRLKSGEMADELPALARILRNRASRAEAADRGDDTSGYDLALGWLADGLRFALNDRVGARGGDADLEAHFGRLEFMAQPDAGGTYAQEYRGGFLVDGADPEAAGRSLVETLLLTLADGSLVADDEFQLIIVDGGESFIVVLPGVADLGSPDPGLHDEHRSVRDLDRFALPSAANTLLADNEYAVMVQRAMEVAGVPFGADVAIVGHSYGADAALDLAADAGFNGGPAGYNVTHVVATGYHSGPQLHRVGRATEVLVLQNHHDAAVLAEMAGDSINRAIEQAKGHDPAGVFDRLGRAVCDGVENLGDAIVDTGQFVGGLLVNAGSDAINREARHFGIDEALGKVDWGDLDDIFLIEDGVDQPTDHQTVVVFEGDWQGAGHHPNNYADHVASTSERATVDFFRSIAVEGYTGTMDRWSIDVTVPG